MKTSNQHSKQTNTKTTTAKTRELAQKILHAIPHYFADWTLFEKVWLALFSAITIYLFFAWNDTYLGLIAALTGMMSVILTAKGKISSYYYGIPNIFLYAYIAYGNKYFGEVQLNLLYFLPMSVIGIMLWKKHANTKKSKDDVLVRYLSNNERVFWIGASIAGIIAYGLFLRAIGGAIPFVDAATNVLSIIAMLLLVKRAVEQWVSWIIVDILTIIMWLRAFLLTGNDVTILVMWIAYLFNAIYGLINWIKIERAHRQARPQN